LDNKRFDRVAEPRTFQAQPASYLAQLLGRLETLERDIMPTKALTKARV